MLLEHTSLEIQRDVDTMKAKCPENVCTISALIADPSILAVPNGNNDDGNGVGSGFVEDKSAQGGSMRSTCKDLIDGELAQLMKLNQLTISQVDRLDKNLKEKQTKLDPTKPDQLKYAEQ